MSFFDVGDRSQAVTFFSNYDLDSPHISLAGIRTYCRIVDVYDGDSLSIVLPYNDLNHVYKFQVRLQNIDTCEITSKTLANREKAVKARNRVIELLTNISQPQSLQSRKDVQKLFRDGVYVAWIELSEMDKYNRVLADIYPIGHTSTTSRSISSILLEERLAYPYSGETKKSEVEQIAALNPYPSII
jgi:endonuclease YncB( thermonuclease family)